MKDYLDEICLLVICSILAITHTESAFAVSGFLAGVIIVCVASSKNKPLRLVLQAVFVACSCGSIIFLLFLPLAAYTMMHERTWPLRLLWIAPLVVQTLLESPILTIAWIAALCVVASIMAVKDIRSESEHKGLERAYDHLREQTMVMERDADTSRYDGASTPSSYSSTCTPSDCRSARSSSQSISPTTSSHRYEPAFFEGLTERELAVVNLVAEGMDNREIAQKLFLSEGTVRNHISAILSKKGLNNRTQIAVGYYRG